MFQASMPRALARSKPFNQPAIRLSTTLHSALRCRYSTAPNMTMTSAPPGRTYSDAIKSLNTLQSNHAILAAIRASGRSMNGQAIPEMLAWLSQIGYTPESLSALNILHVAGTKGKGSTCAFISSILTHYSTLPWSPITKTGLYTSPHLRSVRERIQVNNTPLSEEAFAKYFFEVWDRMEAGAIREGKDPKMKPVYFRYLTLVAFHAFLREGVDSAVFEVGVGGEYDSTNVIASPTVTGITSLGLDHVGVLGGTIEEIAWHKAGIIKAGAKVYTVPQPREALEVVKQRAEDKNVECEVVEVHPEIQDEKVVLGLEGEFQKMNASLAVAMVGEHLKKLGMEKVQRSLQLPAEVKQGLKRVKWAGRCQIVNEKDVEWCIDGAHTTESLEAAGKWFAGVVHTHGKRVLMFNQQNRDAPEKLVGALVAELRKYLGIGKLFDHAVFCTNVTFREQGYKADLMSIGSDKEAVNALSVQKALAEAWHDMDPEAETHTFATIEEAVAFCRQLHTKQNGVTNGVHEVGNGISRLSNGTNGASNGMNGASNGTNGANNGTNGASNRTNGTSKGTNGASNGTNGTNGKVHEHSNPEIQVFTTGSLHLVGGLLEVLDYTEDLKA